MPKRTNKAIYDYQTKKGETRYGFKTYLGIDPETGKKKKITRMGFHSYNEANATFIKLKADGVTKSVDKDITMNALFKMWFKTYEKTVKVSTSVKAKELYDLHIKPTFGKTLITKITPAKLQKYIDKLSDKLVKYRLAMNYISRMYKYAINLNLALNDPTTNVIIPKKTSRPRRDTSHNFYNRDELDEFLSVAKDYNEKMYIYFLILASTGLRRSEALALTWDDIDFNNQIIDVNKTLAQGAGQSLIVQPPKSKKSIRRVPMTDNLSLQLKKYKLKYGKNKKLFYTFYGEYYKLSAPHGWLERIYKQDKTLKHITIHGFRHTFASLLFEADPNIKPTDVQAILGHETVEMTMNIYTHMTDKGQERVSVALNNLNI